MQNAMAVIGIAPPYLHGPPVFPLPLRSLLQVGMSISSVHSRDLVRKSGFRGFPVKVLDSEYLARGMCIGGSLSIKSAGCVRGK